MKGILLDENVPARISLPTSLPVGHVSILGTSPKDSEIWDYARRDELIVVTKDTDFSYRIIATDPPPLIVHLRIGNLRLKDFRALLERVWPQVEMHLNVSKLVNVYENRIEVVT